MRISRGGPIGVASFLKSIITTCPPGRSISFMWARYLSWSSTWCQVSRAEEAVDGAGPEQGVVEVGEHAPHVVEARVPHPAVQVADHVGVHVHRIHAPGGTHLLRQAYQ